MQSARVRYALPHPQSTTVNGLSPGSSLITSSTTFRNSFTWSYLPRCEARMRPSPSARPVTRRSAVELNDASGVFFTLSCGCTTATRSISALRVAITCPLRVTRTWRSPFAVIRWRSLAPFCAMISSSPSAAPFASKFFTRTVPSSTISAW